MCEHIPREANIWTAKSAFRADLRGFDDGLKRSLLEEWVAKNCTMPALVQKTKSYGCEWSIWFCDGVLRRESFANWALNTDRHKHHRFTVDLPQNNRIGRAREIEEYVHNCIDKYSLCVTDTSAFVVFWEETDAIEFKLRWSDDFEPDPSYDDVPF